MQSMKRLKVSLLYDNVHFLFLFILLFLLSIKYWYLSFILFFYTIFIFRKTKLFYLCLIIAGITLLSYTKYWINNEIEPFFDGVVLECSDDSAVVYTNGIKIIVSHDGQLNIGDFGYFNVEEIKLENELFDYEEYLLNYNIKEYIKLKEFVFKDNYFVIGKIQNFFLNLCDKNPSSYNEYLKALLFAKNEIDSNMKTATTNLGISHLLAVSGMHISLLITAVRFLLKKIFYFEKPIDICVIIFLIFYLFVTNFSITVLRACLLVILQIIFSRKELLFTKLDTLSICGLIMLLINPRYLFLLSFQLSFLSSFIIIIFIRNYSSQNKIKQAYLTTFVIFLVTLPFIIKTNYEFNLLTIIFGPIISLYFELLLFPASMIMFIIPKSSIILDFVFLFFEDITMILANINIFTFVIGDIGVFEFIIYEVLVYFLLVSFEAKRGRRYLVIIYLLYLIFLGNRLAFNPFYKVTFYNVGQGDSALISLPNDRGYVLIDCYNNICDYLKKDGIKKIDIVFLSHGHTDHVNKYFDVVFKFDVKKTYISYYDKTIRLNESNTIEKLRSGDIVIFKEIEFNVLGPIKKYSNENDNSLVIRFILDDSSFLFTGDIEKSEIDLIDKYKSRLQTDVLKVAHHGSKSSSSKLFLEYVKPKEMIISVGKNNIYNLPNNKYLLSLDNVYRTDLDGTIIIRCKKNNRYLKKYKE